VKDKNRFEHKHKARELAVAALYSLDFNGKLNDSVDLTCLPGLNEEEMDELSEETSFFSKYLITGTLENLPEIDSLIGKYSINRPLDRINYVDRAILRVSIFQLLHDKDTHPSVIIDEGVKLSQELSTEVTYKFINGILDNISKKEEAR